VSRLGMKLRKRGCSDEAVVGMLIVSRRVAVCRRGATGHIAARAVVPPA